MGKTFKEKKSYLETEIEKQEKQIKKEENKIQKEENKTFKTEKQRETSEKKRKTSEKKIVKYNGEIQQNKEKINQLEKLYIKYIEDATNRLNAEIKKVEAEIKEVEVEIKNNKIQMSQLGVDNIKKQLENNENKKEMGVFLTGFTTKNETWKAENNETKELLREQYFEEENELYDIFLEKLKVYDNSDLDSRNLKKKIIDEAREYIQISTPNQFVNYLFENDFGKTTHLHMYRAPRDCILIADEVHLQTCVSSNISLILQALWKYTSNTKYTIFCTATPMSAGDLFKQMYTLSKMLDEGEGGSKIPVWSIQGIRKARETDMPKLKNVFQAA